MVRVPFFSRVPWAPRIRTLQAATGCGRLPWVVDTGNTKCSGRSRHIARGSVVAPRLAFPYYVVPWATLTETAPGGNATLKASIEYGGVRTQANWSASPSIVIIDGTVCALSYPMTGVSIADGDPFFVKHYLTAATGVIYSPGTGDVASVSGADNANGESFRVGSGCTDETMDAGVIVNGTDKPGHMYAPMLIVADTAKNAFMLIGDSLTLGYLDAYTGTSGDRGLTARPFGAIGGYCVMGVGGELTGDFKNSHTRRISTKEYFSHIAIDYGTNDFRQGVAAATIAANLSTIAGYFPDQFVLVCTLPPDATSSDLWATLGNQTPHANNSIRVTLNNLIRAGLSGVDGYLEIADILESSRDSGKWKVNGAANYLTSDGTHTTNTADLLVQTNLDLSAYA